MSAPVDVLAVMDEAAKDYEEQAFHSSYANEMREARAAVAELVEAHRAHEAADANLRAVMGRDGSFSNAYDVASAERVEAKKRLRAALAKFGEG